MMGSGGQALPQATHNKVYQEVQGMVLDADSKSGLATISLGTDSGIKSGNTLEVYRLGSNPKHLGKIEILGVQADRAVGRLVDVAPSDVLEKGALVAGKLTGNADGKAAGEAITSSQESKERMMLLERRVQQLMIEVDALRGELKQQPGKQPSNFPPKARPEGNDPAKH